jgi:DNA adenine methylase
MPRSRTPPPPSPPSPAEPEENSGGFLPRAIPRTIVPPIKCQGIKTKLAGFIAGSVRWSGRGRWIEPFLGSGVVLFTLAPDQALVADTNIHIVRLYSQLQAGVLDEGKVRNHLETSGVKLAREGADYYYRVRDAFNSAWNPLDFLFLNRSCCNGVMRFNKEGRFNVPFVKSRTAFALPTSRKSATRSRPFAG